jgi:crotonobetainyl-CoA:carnitine CoA-transferase CaiB-like acyl-CoA transferase
MVSDPKYAQVRRAWVVAHVNKNDTQQLRYDQPYRVWIFSMKPFKKITVLDISQGIAGPMCGAILARQGAKVIKVEPLSGDWMRGTGAAREQMSANVISGNINKRSIAVDASKTEGRETLLRLAKQADVLVENFRTGVMARLGLDYPSLKALNPGLIYCSVSGFGPHGPYATKAATDSVLQAFTGMLVANGIKTSVDGVAGLTPKRIGLYVPDNISAIYAAQAVSAALFERTETKLGQHIEISLAEASSAFQAGPMIDSFLFPDANERGAVLAPAGDFQTADGWIIVASLTDEMFQRLAKAVDREEWLRDPRFSENGERKRNFNVINAALAEVLKERGNVEWLQRLEAADILVSSVNDYVAFRDAEQTRAMGYFGELDQAPYGRLTVPHLPASDHELRPAPRLGEHTREILAESGFGQIEIEALVTHGVVRQYAS